MEVVKYELRIRTDEDTSYKLYLFVTYGTTKWDTAHVSNMRYSLIHHISQHIPSYSGKDINDTDLLSKLVESYRRVGVTANRIEEFREKIYAEYPEEFI